MFEKTVNSLIKRIERLEKVVFGNELTGKKAVVSRSFSRKGKAKGPAGGIRQLFEKGFFRTKRSGDDVCKELEKMGYHYGRTQIGTALTRHSKKRGILVVFKDASPHLYAERK